MVSGEVPHPKGMIRIRLDKKEGKTKVTLNCRKDCPGIFVADGRKTNLKPGHQSGVVNKI